MNTPTPKATPNDRAELRTAELLMKIQLELEVHFGDGTGETGAQILKVVEPYVRHLTLAAHHTQQKVLEAKISAAKEILEYRSYEIGEGAKQIVIPRGERRRFVDEFDFRGHINSWEAELTALQETNGTLPGKE